MEDVLSKYTQSSFIWQALILQIRDCKTIEITERIVMLPLAEVCFMPAYLRKRSILGIFLVVIVLLSSCSPFAAQRGQSSTSVATPTGTASVEQACNASNCPPISAIPGVRPFPNTWNNIHLFQTF